MSNEIVNAELLPAEVSPIEDERLVKLAEQIEKRIEAMKKIKKWALSLTNASDWSNQNGKPYMETSGAEKIGRGFGVQWKFLDKEPLIEYEESGHFMYTYRGIFSLAGATIEVIGTRSSKDGFFTRGGKIPISEIDKGDVKKSAYTNMVQAGITRILGLRNITWAELKEFAGISQDQVKSIDYKVDGKTQDRHIASEEAKVATFIPADVRKKSGTKNNKTWTMYLVKSPAGAEYSTFSETLAGIAKEAKEAARSIDVTFTVTQHGNAIEALKFTEEIPKEAPKEGEAV